ncbi:MAG: Methylamine utilization protein MauE [Hydrocarboniphaga sp.]|uniref:MauE/DoxX family redox-associated membrane protein n=1 Tax=Hydrocarboniphaga sp. TaxID=2033016 RepID=UPI0026256EF2|nr:MauE/DoxX family redox-associated membrane protein [Hydrocarboniphaga sp.]MDB5970924.1 Methylamine utilization protein MauE [Hydrocarboniphaga sp.]
MSHDIISGILNAVLQAALGALLLGSGLAKRRAFVAWWQALGMYRALPLRMKPLIAQVIPAAEIALGTLLVLPLFDAFAALLAAALFALFALVVAINWALGVSRFDCGCQFGSRRSHARVILARAVALSVLSGASMLLPATAPLEAGVCAVTALLIALIALSWRQLAATPRLN